MSGLSPLAPHAATPSELSAQLAAERAGLPFLVVRDSDDVQRLVILEPEPARRVIGRRAGCEVPLSWDGEISRAHAVLERLGDEWAISDDGLSSNGTWIRGERIRTPRVLRDGDVIVVGNTMLGFRQPVDSSTAIATVNHADAQVQVSPAQRSVLVALCRPLLNGGTSPAANQDIADELVLGIETVKSHVKALYQRFGLDDLPAAEKRAALAHAAIRLSVVSARDLP